MPFDILLKSFENRTLAEQPVPPSVVLRQNAFLSLERTDEVLEIDISRKVDKNLPIHTEKHRNSVQYETRYI